MQFDSTYAIIIAISHTLIPFIMKIIFKVFTLFNIRTSLQVLIKSLDY
jgi:hypothetical protein